MATYYVAHVRLTPTESTSSVTERVMAVYSTEAPSPKIAAARVRRAVHPVETFELLVTSKRLPVGYEGAVTSV